MITTRTVVSDVKDSKLDRWQRILTEAAEQSRRGKIPERVEPMDFTDINLEAYDRAIIPYEEANGKTLKDVLQPGLTRIAILIGAEGGFTLDEVQQVQAVPVTLGKRILRAETAAIATVSNVIYELT
jgi:16S rRNA (uracil1498-N3)-methyltransferase